jgi:hypothetical protein
MEGVMLMSILLPTFYMGLTRLYAKFLAALKFQAVAKFSHPGS